MTFFKVLLWPPQSHSLSRTCWDRLQVRRLCVVVVCCWGGSWGEGGGGGGAAGPEGGALWAPQVWLEKEPKKRIMGKKSECVCLYSCFIYSINYQLFYLENHFDWWFIRYTVVFPLSETFSHIVFITVLQNTFLHFKRPESFNKTFNVKHCETFAGCADFMIEPVKSIDLNDRVHLISRSIRQLYSCWSFHSASPTSHSFYILSTCELHANSHHHAGVPVQVWRGRGGVACWVELVESPAAGRLVRGKREVFTGSRRQRAFLLALHVSCWGKHGWLKPFKDRCKVSSSAACRQKQNRRNFTCCNDALTPERTSLHWPTAKCRQSANSELLYSRVTPCTFIELHRFSRSC